ncbi:MAG TPA: hypothetical protein DCQ64_20280 [Candidatus Rokubacteria bacterium]|nr:hypothetical protein [Candidatus Rokubacteria bacterium]
MPLADALKRATRTFVQSFVGTLLATWMALNLSPGTLPDTDTAKRVLIAATVAGVIALLSWTQNALEDAGAVPKVLK